MLPFRIKIRPVEIFTGATPGSSLVVKYVIFFPKVKSIRKWSDLCKIVHDPDLTVPALRRLYRSPRDIDLYVGVLLEKQPRPLGPRRRNSGVGRRQNQRRRRRPNNLGRRGER